MTLALTLTLTLTLTVQLHLAARYRKHRVQFAAFVALG